VARAKRTDRAEARRRHRAEAAARGTGEVDEASTSDTPPPTRGKPAPPPPPARPSIGTAFRTAFRPVDFRADLAYLPRLLTSRAIFIPVALSILATFLSLTQGAASQLVDPSPSPSVSASASPAPDVSITPSPPASASASVSASPSPSPSPSASASASPSASATPSASASPSASPGASPSPAPGGGGGGIVGFVGDTLFTFFVVPPPVAAAFITGFLAPRASYLAGFIVALVSVGCLAVVAYSLPELEAGRRQEVIQQALILSPASGALYAAAAAWYKRFLNLANPNRAARAQQSRRSNQRPMRSRSPQRRR
jgi:hypothetical protein